MVMIAHASLGEGGKVKNGVAGDQTGKEVCTRSWYSKPWNYVIRFKPASMRDRIAFCMEAAAENDHIGYDQNQRNTLLNKARKYNYDVSKVTEDCECDCSSLVSVACMYAGVPESLLVMGGNCATTRTIKNLLKLTGEVEVFQTALYTGRPERLMRGDILLAEGKHVAVVVQEDNTNPYKLSKVSLTIGCKGESVKWLQWQLNHNGAALEVDGIFGKKTKLAVMIFQKDNDDVDGQPLKVDGIAGSKTIGALKMT